MRALHRHGHCGCRHDGRRFRVTVGHLRELADPLLGCFVWLLRMLVPDVERRHQHVRHDTADDHDEVIQQSWIKDA
jgi:hypothetical protein